MNITEQNVDELWKHIETMMGSTAAARMRESWQEEINDVEKMRAALPDPPEFTLTTVKYRLLLKAYFLHAIYQSPSYDDVAG